MIILDNEGNALKIKAPKKIRVIKSSFFSIPIKYNEIKIIEKPKSDSSSRKYFGISLTVANLVSIFTLLLIKLFILSLKRSVLLYTISSLFAPKDSIKSFVISACKICLSFPQLKILFLIIILCNR